MKKVLALTTCVLLTFGIKAQKKALTETGDEVILYDDGTWKYVNEEEMVQYEIPVNSKEFNKSDKASFLLKSSKVDLGIYIDPKKWKFKKAVNNEDAEYEFQLKDGDLYGMLIAEKIEIPLASLKEIAIENGRNVAQDFTLMKEEYRNVNGMEVLYLQMHGTVHGIPIIYNGYYFSNSSGTVQFLTYTSQNIYEEYKKETEEFLNGLVAGNKD